MSRRQRAYLAGPMRGYPEYNFPAFHAAAARLRGQGLIVWSPAENNVNQDGFDPSKDTAQPMVHYMKRDLPAVLDADMVTVLPGWEKSQGARLEVTVALTCGIPVYKAENMQPVSEVPALHGPSSGVPAGWKLVPEQPTEEMLDACIDLTLAHALAIHSSAVPWEDGYKAMLEAAPLYATSGSSKA